VSPISAHLVLTSREMYRTLDVWLTDSNSILVD